MVTRRGQVKVLDFGLAKVARRVVEEPLASQAPTQAKTQALRVLERHVPTMEAVRLPRQRRAVLGIAAR